MKQYTYNKQANKLIEQASMVKPKPGRCFPETYDKYNAHIASLRQIDCSPQCREVWEDGQEVKEGEFEINDNGIECLAVPFGYAAYPIHQEQESEDEIPKEFLDYIKEAWNKIKYEGEVKTFPKYGGSVFVVFKNNRTYRLNLSLYKSEVSLD